MLSFTGNREAPVPTAAVFGDGPPPRSPPGRARGAVASAGEQDMEEQQEAPPPPYQSSWEDPGAPPMAEPADGAPPPAGERPTDGARKFFGRLSKQAATISKQAGRHATKMYHKAQKEVRNLQERLQDGEPPSAAGVAPRHSADPARVASRESLDAVPWAPADDAGAGPGPRAHDGNSGVEPRQPDQEHGGPASSAGITPPAVVQCAKKATPRNGLRPFGTPSGTWCFNSRKRTGPPLERRVHLDTWQKRVSQLVKSVS